MRIYQVTAKGVSLGIYYAVSESKACEIVSVGALVDALAQPSDLEATEVTSFVLYKRDEAGAVTRHADTCFNPLAWWTARVLDALGRATRDGGYIDAQRWWESVEREALRGWPEREVYWITPSTGWAPSLARGVER